MKSLKTLYSWGLAQIPCQTKENYLGNTGLVLLSKLQVLSYSQWW